MPTPSISSAMPQVRPQAVPKSHPDRNADFLNRATGGYTLEEHERLNAMGRPGWLREQLGLSGADNQSLDLALSVLPSTQVTGQDYYDDFRGRAGAAAREMQQEAITRAVLSRWQLRERMVDFWHDHFSVTLQSTGVTRLGHHEYDRHVIRAHVFGRFEDMLLASAKSVSMLDYLDGAENVAGGPNENYAREVMELHTLGVDGPYTETDIAELARCLTGWSFYGLNHPTLAGQFRFRDNRHDGGAKTVLGVQVQPGGGVSDGETILSFLASHRSTIDFVSRKLVRRFVSESAPEAAVERVKSAWARSQGNLKIVTAVLFSDAVADLARPMRNRKVKRPLQFATGLLRAAGITSDNAYRTVAARLRFMGQDVFNWPAPNGYPDSSAAWSGDLYNRWRFASDLFRGNLPGLPLPDASLDRIRAGVADSQLARRLDLVFTGGRSAADDVQRIQAFIDGRPNFDQRDFRDALGMTASIPDFLLA